eukprot:11105447-Karenia_brevis.AAC.1
MPVLGHRTDISDGDGTTAGWPELAPMKDRILAGWPMLTPMIALAETRLALKCFLTLARRRRLPLFFVQRC